MTKPFIMKQTLHIEADFDKPELLKSMVEKLVMRGMKAMSHLPFLTWIIKRWKVFLQKRMYGDQFQLMKMKP